MSFGELHVLETLIYVPMLAAAVLIFIPRPQIQAIRYTSVGVGALLLLLSIYAFASFDYGEGGATFQLTRTYPWLERLGISFALGIDGIAAPMVLLTGIVTAAATLVAANINRDAKDYYILLFLLIAGVYGTFISTDLFFFFFFYELAIVPMYLLIGVWGSSSKFKDFDRPKEYGALKLVMMIVAASLLVWIAVIVIYVEAGQGSFSFEALVRASQQGRLDSVQNWLVPCVIVGFGLLGGLWPFHTWSPDGHVAAPTSVSMLHAGVLMKLGAFGIIRVGLMLMPDGMDNWHLVLFILGTINVIYGAVSALAQTDLKYVVGYSSVSHMGYVFMGIATLDVYGLTGATMQMFSHGVMTALFFTIVGAIYERSHTRDTMVLNGLATRMKWATAFFVIAGLASLGLPGLSGFISEVWVFYGAFRTEPILGALAVVGAAITAVYILRLIGRTFFGDRDPKWDGLTDLTAREWVAAAILLVPIFAVGLYPEPLLRVIGPGVDAILAGFGG